MSILILPYNTPSIWHGVMVRMNVFRIKARKSKYLTQSRTLEEQHSLPCVCVYVLSLGLYAKLLDKSFWKRRSTDCNKFRPCHLSQYNARIIKLYTYVNWSAGVCFIYDERFWHFSYDKFNFFQFLLSKEHIFFTWENETISAISLIVF